MEYRGDKNGVSGSEEKDWRETVVMLRLMEDRQSQLKEALAKLDTQINAENGIKDRLAETRIISAERYKNAIRRQNCGYVIAGALIVGIVTWVTVQFGQMRDRDMVRERLAQPQLQGVLPGQQGPQIK